MDNKYTDEQKEEFCQIVKHSIENTTFEGEAKQKVLKTRYLYSTLSANGFHCIAAYCYAVTHDQYGVVFARVGKKCKTINTTMGINETAVFDMYKELTDINKESVKTLYGK